MTRWFRLFILTLFLASLVAVAALWVRSYFASELLYCSWVDREGSSIIYRELVVDCGRGNVSFSFTRLLDPPRSSWMRNRLEFQSGVPDDAANDLDWPPGGSQGSFAGVRMSRFANSTGTYRSVNVPLRMLVLSLGVLVAFWIWKARLRKSACRKGYCPRCGYDLRASKERCPECGKVITTTAPASHQHG